MCTVDSVDPGRVLYLDPAQTHTSPVSYTHLDVYKRQTFLNITSTIRMNELLSYKRGF